MRAFVDTSVLLAAANADHIHYGPSHELMLSLHRRHDACAAHSLAGLYSTLTRMPFPQRRNASQAMLFVADVQARLAPIALTPEEYFAAISEYSAMGVVGGAIYAALIARCALKARAKTIYTWNIRLFRQFGPEVEKKLRTP